MGTGTLIVPGNSKAEILNDCYEDPGKAENPG